MIFENAAMTAYSFPIDCRIRSRRHQISLPAIAMILFAVFLATPLKAAERHHHAHEHGVSTLKIAVDGPLLEMQLVSPGMDIVGFEHAPSTDTDRQAVAKAGALLAEGGTLFILSADAKCGLVNADVDHPYLSTDTRKHAHGDKRGQEHADKHGHDHCAQHGHRDAADDGHSAFQAQYRFRCEDIGKLRRMDVKLFEKFPAAREIEVEAITPRGQIARELTPASPRLDF